MTWYTGTQYHSNFKTIFTSLYKQPQALKACKLTFMPITCFYSVPDYDTWYTNVKQQQIASGIKTNVYGYNLVV